MHSVLDPVEPPRLDNNKLKALIVGYILPLTSVRPLPVTPLTWPGHNFIFSGTWNIFVQAKPFTHIRITASSSNDERKD